MTHVHYKFSSKLSYDTVVFDGPHITLRDLKRQIMGREKLRAADCDLQITNAQSKQEYTEDDCHIPKGSSVIVRRIPVSGGKSSSSSKTSIESSTVQFQPFGAIKAMDDQSSSRALTFFAKMANLAEADVPEEDKIKVVLNQSTYDSMNYSKKFGTVLPANYTCYRCGNTGHHIRNCPSSGDKNFEPPLRIKKSTGIPRSFMVEVDDPNMRGAMLTNCGRFAIPAIDAQAYAVGKKEKPPFVPQENPTLEVEPDPVPDELLCLICRDLLSDAVVIPCCGNSYCDDCIRTTLLDSEEHVCPSCSQSDVSPDTLIANKFLRQAVNNFKKERGYSKGLKSGCGASQNPTTRPSPVPTLQSQPQRPHHQTCTQQDPPQCHPKDADTLPLPRVPPAATDLTSACSTPSTSPQPEQSLEIPDKESEEKKQDENTAAAAAPSVVVSNKEPMAIPLQLTAPSPQVPVVRTPTDTVKLLCVTSVPVQVNQTAAAEQPQTVSINPEQSSSCLASTPSPCGPPTCWDSSSSSSGRPTRGWTDCQPRTSSSSSSSSYSTATPPLFPSPLFLSAHQSHCIYPPGYQPATPVWTTPSPQGLPIPTLCSSTPTSSIPSLIPDEWYRHQRNRKERSPHRGSTYRRSTSSSHSKSTKSKSSRSYSRSSSRSRSRSPSRSQGRSRHLSPYSHHRDLRSRSYATSSYSYGYKRSPTPSSSSSPRVAHYSSSKSPSDHQKKRHQNKKSASGSCSTRRRGERSDREVGGSEEGFATYLYTQCGNQTTGLDLDRERYLQWKKEYKDWCEKYFSNYVSQFHQLPLPLISLPPPPPPPPQWVDREGSTKHLHVSSDSHYQPQGRRAAQADGHSPSSQSSSDGRSPPSQSSSDSHCTTSQSLSDSRSSTSHISNDSHSSSKSRSTPCEDRAQSSAYQHKYKHLQITIRKGMKEGELHDRSMKNVEDLSSVKHDQKKMKKHEARKGEKSSSPDATDPTDGRRRDARRRDTALQDEGFTSNTLKSVPQSLKADKSDKHSDKESREQRKRKREKEWRRGKYSDSRQEVEGPHKEKPSKEVDTVDTNRHRNPGGGEAADTRSEKKKRKGEELERNETQRASESPKLSDRKKQKSEKTKEIKTLPLTENDIWEEGIKVKPQKKISININLDGKRKEAKSEKQELSCSESIAGKTKEGKEKCGDGDEKFSRTPDAEVNEEFSDEIIKPGGLEGSRLWEKATFRDDEANIQEKISDTGAKKEDREEEDFDLWRCALRGVVKEKTESEMPWEEGERKEASEDVVTGKEQGGEPIRNESEGHEMGADGRGTWDKNREIPLEVEQRVESAKRSKTEEEDTIRTKEQMSRHKSHNITLNTAAEAGSSCEDRQERTVVKPLEQYSRDNTTEKEDDLLLQVPLSKWEESEEEEQRKAEITAQDALPLDLPPVLVAPTNQKRQGENEQKRQRSVDIERDRDAAEQRGRDAKNQKGSIWPVAPSSGSYRNDSTLCTDNVAEKEMQLEKQRDREKDGRRSKEKKREEEKKQYQKSERGYSSTVLHHKRNHPSSSHFSSSSVSHDLKCRDETYPCDGLNYKYLSHQDGNAETTCSPSSLSHSQCKNTDPLPFKFVSLKPRSRSPSWELVQKRSRKETKEEHGDWKHNKVDKLIKESKENSESTEPVAEREGGTQGENEADAFSNKTKWEDRRELEDGERPSSRSSNSSSPASLENSKDERRKGRKKQKKHKKERRQSALELLEDRELKKHKKSKKTRDGEDGDGRERERR